jgi:mannose-6-phosphate isomerase-like protein (cupin superfamily)
MHINSCHTIACLNRVSLVKKLLCFQLLVGLSLTTAQSLMADSAATVTEAVNVVDHGTTQSTDTTPAKVGTTLHNGEYLKTGAQSRAELTLANQSVTRVGANTIFDYSVADNQIDLQSGTILFSKPKDGKTMTIKTAAVTAAIVGTTGFIQTHGNTVLFGLVEGTVTMTIGGVDYTITSGQILKLTPGQPPQIFSFNVPLFLSTSPLITKFHHHLPNDKAIQDEVADYNDLVSRGFIQPPSDPFYLIDPVGYHPLVPLPGIDSAGQAHNQFNMPPPTQPVQNECRPRCCRPRCCGGQQQVG